MDEMKALTEKLENIEIILSAALNSANDPKKRQEEVEILQSAAESIKATSKDISGLISAEKGLIEGFKPVVEQRNYSIDVKQPLWWIVGAMGVILLAFVVCFALYEKMDSYKQLSIERYDNDMKYRYMRSFGSKSTRKEMLEFSVHYDQGDNWQGYAEKVNRREQEVRQAFEASKNAQLQEETAQKAKQEARRLREQADSLNGD